MWLSRCTGGVVGTWGNVELRGRYFAGFDPDVVGPDRGMAGPCWSRKRADAIRFLSREEAEACRNAAPAGAPLRPDGTPNRPPPVCRVAVEYELPRLPRSRRTPGVTASWNSPAWTGPSDLPATLPATSTGHSPPAARLAATPVPPCNLPAARA